MYVYIAGVSRVGIQLKSDHAFWYGARHPNAKKWKQQVRTTNAWCVPELVGPTVPSREKDSEKRAMLLLILLKPWAEDVAHLLEKTDAVEA